MKNIISLLLTFIITCSALVGCRDKVVNTTEDLSETPIEYFGYKENEEGGITIVSYTGEFESIVIPSEIDGKPVTELGPKCFGWRNDTTTLSVVLPNTLKIIGPAAFENCTSLEKVVLPKSLTQIYAKAFFNCTSLKHITIPSDCLNSNGSEVFAYSALETVELKEGVKCIPESTFIYTNLKEVILPSTVEEINWQAFGGCELLKNVVLNEGLKTIKHSAFTYDTMLEEIIIPETVESLSEYAFSYCTNLKAIKFKGDAPEEFICENELLNSVYSEYYPSFIIYFHKGAEGFTSPTWNGFLTEIW